ncbi:MAG TPA: SpaA isopeptide-forming pilin-related protein [Gaiellaceae bacterium]|nr:SpaA isopeptide-forming pilin-related protein [Gaiellaceae bacterium]
MALLLPLAATVALVLTGLVGAVPLPPGGAAVNNPTFEFDAASSANGILTDDADTDGVLDWDDDGDGTAGPGQGVINATRNADGTCTQTNLPATAGTTGVVGSGLLICDGSAGNFDDLDGFTQGSKNEGTAWNIDNIGQPKKADLSELMIYAKFGDSSADSDTLADDLFVFTGATRLDVNGSTHLDVELNKQDVKRNCPDSEPGTAGYQTSNCTPQRTNGDILIAIDVSQGGAVPTLRVYQFKTTLGPGQVCANAPQVTAPCLVDLGGGPAGAAVGELNVNGEIQGPLWDAVGCERTSDDNSPGCRIRDDVPAKGFMETYTDLTAFGIEVTCPGFSNVIFKTRSSDELNSSLQDDAEGTINISQCSLEWEKRDDLGALQGGATFTVQGSTAGPFACLDADSTGPDDANPVIVADNSPPDADPDAGQLKLDNICFGTYTVTETVAPSGFARDDDLSRTVTVDASNQQAKIGTQGTNDCAAAAVNSRDFCNRLGSLAWEKRDETSGNSGSHALQGGATFSVSGGSGPFACRGTSGAITVVDNGTNDADADAGQILVNRVCLGTYTITETAAPSGYQADRDTTRSQAVTEAALAGVVGSALTAPPSTDDEGTRNATTGECTNEECDFHNRKGSLLIRKEGKDARTPATNDLLGGATFEISPDPTDGVGTLVVTDNGAGDANSTAGLICIDNALIRSDYSIKETAAPANYAKASPDTQTGKSSTAQNCSERSATSPDATFVNTPLSKIQVIFTSLAGSGVTVASINCAQGGTAIPSQDEDGSSDPAVRDDTNESYGNGTSTLLPGVYTCTVDIDP